MVFSSQIFLFYFLPFSLLAYYSLRKASQRARNLCLGALIEAVRDQTRIVDLKQVNRVLIQPHWRKDCDQPIA